MLATLRPAIDTAEQAAVVDILSGGRLELGLGTGYRVPEFEAFGADMSRRYELLEERCEEIRAALGGRAALAAPGAGAAAALDRRRGPARRPPRGPGRRRADGLAR